MRLTRIIFACALVATSLGCQSGNEQTIPDGLSGVWVTSHPKYADRYFQLKDDVIIFGTGKETIELHALMNIDATPYGDIIHYTISHLNHYGQYYTFSFYYNPTNDGTIWFENQKHILWTRVRR